MKKAIAFGIIFLMLVGLPKGASFAAEAENSMVYASRSEQEAVYALTQQESFDYYKILQYDGLLIQKESISPVYSLDMLEYAQSGQFEVKLRLSSNGGKFYTAKCLTEQKEFGGNILFYIENGTAFSVYFTPSTALEDIWPQGDFKNSCSYADHASRIGTIMGDKVSLYDIKYVFIDGIGGCFYIRNNTGEYMIPIGNQRSEGQIDIVWSPADIKVMAQAQLDHHNEILAFEEAWKAEHPGEICDLTGLGGTICFDSGSCSTVDNILDIYGYIENEIDPPTAEAPPQAEPSTDPTETEPPASEPGVAPEEPNVPERPSVWPLYAAVGCVIAAGAVTAIILLRRKKKV